MNGSYAIQKFELTSGDVKYIKENSLKTIFKFLSSEIIGFGFGVPLATISAIGYGNIADIFMEVYFMPIVVITTFVVLFVALPTNLYLIRGLIKVFFTPSLDNLKTLSFSIARIPFYAALNLFFRIAVGGFIVDLYGLYTYKNVSTETFIALFISATFGAWNASILYFFVLQNVIGSYNLKVKDYVLISKKSEVVKFRFLGISIYPVLIFSTFLMTVLIISFADVLGASVLGQIMVTFSGAVAVISLLLVSFSVIKKVLVNTNNVISSWEEEKEKFSMYGLYDVEEILRRLQELHVISLNINYVLSGTLEKVKSVPDSILSSCRDVIYSFDLLPKSLQLKRSQGVKYDELKREISKLNSLNSSLSQEIISMFLDKDSLEARLFYNLQLVKDSIERFSIISESFNMIKQKVYSLSKVTESLENGVSYLKEFSKKIVYSNFEKLEKISKEIEMTLINFQLEMSKIGYPEEFKFISLHLSKVLNSVTNLSRDTKNIANFFEKQIVDIYDNAKSIYVLYDSQVLLISERSSEIGSIVEIFKEVRDFLELSRNEVKNLRFDRSIEKKIYSDISEIMDIESKLSSMLEIWRTLEDSILRIFELQRLINSHVDKVRNMKKILVSYGI